MTRNYVMTRNYYVSILCKSIREYLLHAVIEGLGGLSPSCLRSALFYSVEKNLTYSETFIAFARSIINCKTSKGEAARSKLAQMKANETRTPLFSKYSTSTLSKFGQLASLMCQIFSQEIEQHIHDHDRKMHLVPFSSHHIYGALLWIMGQCRGNLVITGSKTKSNTPKLCP